MQLEGRIIGNRYQIAHKLGEGGLGMVYRGVDLSHNDAPVAIKMLKPQVVHSKPEWVERFRREAEALYRLDHPNIVKVLDTLKVDDFYFIVMEYVAGGSLRQILAHGEPMPIEHILNIALDLSDALVRTHHLKIVHRDVKPDNVLLTPSGRPLLTDFGAAHFSDATALTAAGQFIGTVSYMAPELIMGDKADPRVDVWALGVMLYEMVCGYRPFMGESSRDLLLAIIRQPAPDLAKLRQDCPPKLVKLIHKMLVKDREQRVFSMRQVGAELEQIMYALG